VSGNAPQRAVNHAQPPPAPAFEEAVLRALARLAPGDVVTYGDIAAEAGRPGAARAVGAVLSRSDDPVPWWRVVTASGRLVPGHEREHAKRLVAEGVEVQNGRVRIRRRSR
jgi:methylated-DNA-protein-cysteine methyltransferase related protein